MGKIIILPDISFEAIEGRGRQDVRLSSTFQPPFMIPVTATLDF
jgi:hypothetical protein